VRGLCGNGILINPAAIKAAQKVMIAPP